MTIFWGGCENSSFRRFPFSYANREFFHALKVSFCTFFISIFFIVQYSPYKLFKDSACIFISNSDDSTSLEIHKILCATRNLKFRNLVQDAYLVKSELLQLKPHPFICMRNKKLEIEKTKPTFIILVLKVEY